MEEAKINIGEATKFGEVKGDLISMFQGMLERELQKIDPDRPILEGESILLKQMEIKFTR